jgi:hypothetical protein
MKRRLKVYKETYIKELMVIRQKKRTSVKINRQQTLNPEE